MTVLVWLGSSLRAPSPVPVIAPCWGRAKTPAPSHTARRLLYLGVGSKPTSPGTISSQKCRAKKNSHSS